MPVPVTPLLAADAIIELTDRPGCPIVLIERKNPPPGWAIPGGFVDIGETLEYAAIREALEETCLHIQLKTLLGMYSDPRRDPRGHTVTAVYIAEASGTPVAADDAKTIKIVSLNEIPSPLAFDHAKVLVDYKNYLDTGKLTDLLAVR